MKQVLNDLLQPFFLADPTLRSITGTGSYTIWLYKTFISNFKNFFNGGIAFLADEAKLNELERYLTVHMNNRQNFPEEYKDINNIKSFKALEDIVINIGSEKYQLDADKATDIDILYDDENWFVLEPLTHEAAIVYGKDTDWCTAARSKASRDNYEDYSPLTIIINRKTGEKWQTDPKSGWFNDINDNEVNIYNWTQTYKIPNDLSDILYKRLNFDQFNTHLVNYIKNYIKEDPDNADLEYVLELMQHTKNSAINAILRGITIDSIAINQIRLLFEHGASIKGDTWQRVVDKENPGLIELFFEMNIPIQVSDIHHLIRKNNPELVELLIKYNKRMSNHHLSTAIHTKNPEIVKLVLDAMVSKPDSDNFNLAMGTFWGEDLEKIKDMFAEYGFQEKEKIYEPIDESELVIELDGLDEDFVSAKSVDELIKKAKILSPNEYINRIVKQVKAPNDNKEEGVAFSNFLKNNLIHLFYTDPTFVSEDKASSYTIWLYKTFVNDPSTGLDILVDDARLEELKYYLTYYTNNKQNFPEEYRDINNIKTFQQLEDVVVNLSSKNYKTDEEKADDIELLYEDENWFVLEPLSHEAAINYGKNTNWCTAARSDASYDNYVNWSPLTIIINKKTGEKWQTDPKSGWFKDTRDREVDKYGWIKRFNVPNELLNILYERLQADVFNSQLRNYIETSDIDENHKADLFAKDGPKNILNYIIQYYYIWFGIEGIKELIQAGAKPDRDTLITSINKQDLELIELILQFKHLFQDLGGFTFDRALFTQNPEIINLVMQYGAKPNTYTLHRAIKANNALIVQLALEAGVEIDENSLIYAVNTHNLKIVELILQAGALVTEEAMVAAHLTQVKHPEIIELLRNQLYQQGGWAGKENMDELLQEPEKDERENIAYIKTKNLNNLLIRFGEKSMKATSEMKEFFDARTKKHIDLVKKYCKKIYDIYGDQFEGIIERGEAHDESKWTEPEMEPYIFITWDYKCKDEDKKFDVPDDIKKMMTDASEHHVNNNEHHPEFHCSKKGKINKEDRDANPDEIIDATSMEGLDIVELCADWMAMSEEKGNSPIDWADEKIGKRWKFNDEAIYLIYDILNNVWK